MNNIDTIEINILGMNHYNFIIKPNDNKIIFPEYEKEFSNEYTNKLLDIIYRWDKNYYSNKNIDSEEYEIKIISNKVDIYKGKGVYPDNYNEFRNWVSDVYVKYFN